MIHLHHFDETLSIVYMSTFLLNFSFILLPSSKKSKCTKNSLFRMNKWKPTFVSYCYLWRYIFHLACSTKAWVKHTRRLKSFKVFNGYYRFRWRLGLQQVRLTTPYSNCESSTFGRRFLQICFVPIYNVTLLNAFQFLCFLLGEIEHVPEQKWYCIIGWRCWTTEKDFEFLISCRQRFHYGNVNIRYWKI